MKGNNKMTRLYDKSIEYRILFAVHISHDYSDSDVYVGISKSGDLLCITKYVVSSSAALGSETAVHKLSKSEYRELLESSKNNGLLQESIDKRRITLKEAVMLGNE